jgi:hypothetical protein
MVVTQSSSSEASDCSAGRPASGTVSVVMTWHDTTSVRVVRY